MDPTPLRRMFDTQHDAVRIITTDEDESRQLLLTLASEMDLKPMVWSAVDGLRPGWLVDGEPVPNTTNAGAALKYLTMNLPEPTLAVFFDLADYLDDKLILRTLREFIDHLRVVNAGLNRTNASPGGSRLVLVDHLEQVPDVITAQTARFDIPLPMDEEIDTLVRATLRRLNARRPFSIEDLSKRDFAAIVANLRGLTRRQIELATGELVSDGRFSADDIAHVIEIKRRLLQSMGILSFVDAPTSLDEIGGLNRLKRWLRSRSGSFAPQAGPTTLPPPRGVLLLGVQGAGKSLAAKAIATAWSRPLMRLDPGDLYDKFVGESERHLRNALRQAEAMSPLVLWIDEIEKGFASAAGQSTDGGLSRRLFGTLLTWMQERTQPVFLVATANDIEALPPELLRKGRFDEIFFVDLPDIACRKQIFSIHLRRRGLDPLRFDLDALAAGAEGFSGSEIEQAVLSALHEANADGVQLDSPRLLRSVLGSPPLSVTMKERIDDLRAWARGRCVPAD